MRKGDLLVLMTVVAALIFGAIGYFVSPKGQSGQTMVYSPDVKAVQDYRNKAIKWIDEIKLTGGKIPTLLKSNNSSIYERTQQAQQIFSDLYTLNQEIGNSTAPLAFQELKTELLNTTEAYLQAAQGSLQWVNESSDENLQKTNNLLATAQSSLTELEQSQWINQ